MPIPCSQRYRVHAVDAFSLTLATENRYSCQSHPLVFALFYRDTNVWLVEFNQLTGKFRGCSVSAGRLRICRDISHRCRWRVDILSTPSPAAAWIRAMSQDRRTARASTITARPTRWIRAITTRSTNRTQNRGGKQQKWARQLFRPGRWRRSKIINSK